MQRTMNHDRSPGRPRSAFTLVELLVVVSIIALLIAILLPSLKKAREQAKGVACLSNLRSLGTGVATYATEYNGTLPGPLHPAVYKYQTLQNYLDTGMSEQSAKHSRGRQLTYILSTALGQRGEGREENITDDLATCPVMDSIVPDSHFDAFTAKNYRVWPTHYVINNPPPGAINESEPVGVVGNVRLTKPGPYFGYSPHLGAGQDLLDLAEANPPRSLSTIKRTSDEWMIADAWYRKRVNPASLPQQDGPYQVGYSGEALPHFAPHAKPGSKAVYLSPSQRESAAASIASNKNDGKTQSVFFDGHAEGVQSKSLIINNRSFMYGFPGTVNPKSPLPPTAEWR